MMSAVVGMMHRHHLRRSLLHSNCTTIEARRTTSVAASVVHNNCHRLSTTATANLDAADASSLQSHNHVVHLLHPTTSLHYCSIKSVPAKSSSSSNPAIFSPIAIASLLVSRASPGTIKRYSSSNNNHDQRQQPKLAYEWIVDGKVIPSSKGDDGIIQQQHLIDNDKEVIVFLHGLLGNAKNLRTPAKKLTQQLPHFNALLLDIRGHGNSSSSSSSQPSSFDQPHNFQSCVQDVFDTLAPLGLTGRNSPTAICGHSLGGRIALQYSHSLCTTTATTTSSSTGRQDMEIMTEIIEPPKQTWVLDSVPGQADPSVHNVLRAISSLSNSSSGSGTPITSKSWLVETLIGEYKLSKGVAMWIATNLRPVQHPDGGRGKDGKRNKCFDWVFDLDIANELVANFKDQNIVEMIRDVTAAAASSDSSSVSGNNNNSMVQLVMAGKNRLWSEEIISELESIPSFRQQQKKQQKSPLSLFQMHTLDKAGHWVHVDDLEGLVKLMVDGLQQQQQQQ